MKIKILAYVCFMHFIITYVIECLMMFGFLSLNTDLESYINKDLLKEELIVPTNRTDQEKAFDVILRNDNILTYVNGSQTKIKFFYIGYVISFIYLGMLISSLKKFNQKKVLKDGIYEEQRDEEETNHDELNDSLY